LFRADKIKKKLRGAAAASETDSEHSRGGGNRNSEELRADGTPPLGKIPEKGILKKYPRVSADKNRRSTEEHSVTKESKQGRSSVESPGEKKKNRSLLGDDKIVPSNPVLISEADETSKQNGNVADIDNRSDDGDNGSSCSCSCDEDDLAEVESGVPGDEEQPDEDLGNDSSNNRHTQTDNDSLSDVGEDDDVGSIQKEVVEDDVGSVQRELIDEEGIGSIQRELIDDTTNKKVLLMELQRQIDKQVHLVLGPTGKSRQQEGGGACDLSPTNSEELPCSETEADRSLPRDSFYRQGDIVPVLRPSTNAREPLPSENLVSNSRGSNTSQPNATKQFFVNALPDAVMNSLTVTPSKPASIVSMPSASSAFSDKNNFTPIQRIIGPYPTSTDISPFQPISSSSKSQNFSPQSHSRLSASQFHPPRPVAPFWPSPQRVHVLPALRSPMPKYVRNSPPTDNSINVGSPLRSSDHVLPPTAPYTSKVKQSSVSPKSNSRNYLHLDVGNPFRDVAVKDERSIIQEVSNPSKPVELRFVPDSRGAYTKAPGSSDSLEDFDV